MVLRVPVSIEFGVLVEFGLGAGVSMELGSVVSLAGGSSSLSNVSSPALRQARSDGERRDLVSVAVFLGFLQIVDGVFTAIGVDHFGVQAEGNPLVRTLMSMVGSIPALVIVKLLAISVIIGLVRISNGLVWVVPTLKFVSAVYLFAAVIPWSGILISQL